MISESQSSQIRKQAYVPEHMTDYVTSVSDSEPFLRDTFLCYRKGTTLIVVGYPLGEPSCEKTTGRFLERAEREFKPEAMVVIAPETPAGHSDFNVVNSDSYYRLEARSLRIGSKVKNMVRRAARELIVERTRECTPEHNRLIADFMKKRTLDADTATILERIPRYVSLSETVLVLNARDREGALVAFDVVELGSSDYAFYMFNILARDRYAPGATDLLLKELIDVAVETGKQFVNLGLGINEGVAFFKKKWGALPFLPYRFFRRPLKARTGIESLLDRL
jgi:hypothetical protein